jgi:hypothetical protein
MGPDMSRTKLHPGWKMTSDQHNAYWWYLSQCCKKLGLTSAAEREELRRAIHIRAFGEPISAKEIDRLTGYDAFKKECLAILQPDNLEAQLHMAMQPLIRLRVACRQLADEAYIIAMCRSDRFKKESLDDPTWSEAGLTDLRNTLAARSGSHHRKQTPKPDNDLVPF